MNEVIELTDQNFASMIKDGVCIVDFYAPWCQPCKPVSNIMEKYAKQFPFIHFYKVDVDKCPSIKSACDIMNLPTIYVFWNGEFRTAIFTNFDNSIRRELRNFN